MITLDCYTHRKEIYQYARIKRGVQCYPEWWKNLPHNPNGPIHNMKSCYGLTDLYKKSLVISMWSDFHLSLGEVGNYDDMAACSDGVTEISDHKSEEYQGLLNAKKYQHIKLSSPWVVACKKGVSFSFLGAFWNTVGAQDGMMIPPGVIDFKSQNATNINLFFERFEGKRREFFIPFNAPMVHLIPHTKEKIKLNHHLVSFEEFQELVNYQTRKLTFSNWFNKRKKHLEKKCPFGFGG